MNSTPIVIQLTLSTPAIIGIAFGLIGFGFGFNALITALGEHIQGYTSLMVALGTLITLGAIALFSWQSALLCLVAFSLSGFPMIAGDIFRNIRSRQRAIERSRQALGAIIDRL